MKKFILKPIVFGTLASAIIVGCSSDPKDEVSPKPSCIYSIEGGDSVDIPFGTSYTNPSVNVSQNGVKIIDVKNDGTVDTSKLGIYKVSYSSESCANNKTRTIEVVPSSCAYKLAGASPLEVVLNGTYVELGVEV
ncbi:MAG: DUF5011 domain-containing protein, partial [Cocleimonas sp.]|nr:DUF5011 domain-containing protein [Cocleimonas sp.]